MEYLEASQVLEHPWRTLAGLSLILAALWPAGAKVLEDKPERLQNPEDDCNPRGMA